MQRFLSFIPLLAFLCCNPASADGVADDLSATCIAEPSETCVVALLMKTAEAATGPRQRTHVFNSIAASYDRNARPQDAEPYWDLAHTAALSATDEEARDLALAQQVMWSPNRDDITAVILAAEKISDSEIRDNALITLAELLAEEGRFDQAKNVLSRSIDFGPLAVAFGNLASAQARAGKIEDAWHSFRTYEKAVARVRGDTISLNGNRHSVPAPEPLLEDIAVAEAKAGRRKDSRATLKRIETQEYILFAKVRIARAQAEAGNLSAARKTISEMRLRRGKTESGLPNKHLKDRLRRQRDSARAGVAEAFAGRGDLKKAMSVLSQIKDDERHDEAITDIAYDYVMSGKFEKLPWLLRKKRAPVSLEAESPQILAVYYANAGKPDKAREHFDRIPLEVGFNPFPLAVAIKWSHIATLRHQHGDPEGAPPILEKALAYGKEGNSSRMYGSVAAIVVLHQSKQERFSEAVSTALSIDWIEDRANALRHVLTELLAKQAP